MLHPATRPGARSSIGTYLQYLVGVTVLASSALAASFVARRGDAKTAAPRPHDAPPETPSARDREAER